MKKIITKDGMCYYKKDGIICSRNATPMEIFGRDEYKFQITMEMI